MAWLDFIKRIRQDEDEEQRNPQNKVFGFLDDVLDTTGRRAERVKAAFQSSEDDGYGLENRIQDVVGGVTPEPIKDIVGAAAGFGREVAVKVPLKMANSLREKGQDMGSGAVNSSIRGLQSMSYAERKKALKENEGLRLVMSGRGITDPTDENLKKSFDKEKERDKKQENTVDNQNTLLNDTASKAVLGEEDIQTYQRAKEGNIEKGWNPALASIAMAGGIALDTPGLGSAKKVVQRVGGDFAAKLADVSDTKAVADAVQNATNLTKKQAREIADDIAASTNPDDIMAVVNGRVDAVNDIVDTTRKVIAPAAADVAEAPAVREISPMARQWSEEIDKPDDIIDETTDWLWSQEKEGLNKGSELAKKIRKAGGVSRSDYESFPSSLKNKNGISLDEMATSMGFDSDRALMEALEDQSVPRFTTKAELREQLIEQFERGNGDLIPDQDLVDAYGLVKNRGAEMNSLASTSGPEQFVDAVKTNDRSDLQGGPGRTRLRGYLQTVQRGRGQDPETMKTAAGIEPQRYTQQAQQPVLEEARKLVDLDRSLAIKEVKDPKSPWSDRKAALIKALTDKARADGNEDEVLDLLEQMDTEARGAGRGNAMIAAFGRFSPEGVARFAKRQVEKAQEKEGGAFNKLFVKGDAKTTASTLKREIEDNNRATVEGVSKAIDDLLGSVDPAKADEATVGQKVAKNIASYVDPNVKKKTDTLVNELTKKIKEEMLTPRPGTKPRSATDILKEVFKRRGEADVAIPEAKDILRAKFADNQSVLDELDNFFDSDLLAPAASSTLNRAIRETMSANKVKIAEVIKKSWDEQITETAKVAQALTKEGFSVEDSKLIAEEVGARVKAQITDAKKATLERLMKDAPPRTKQVFEDKLGRLSNLGALGDADYLELAQKQLNLATLDSATAKEIDKLAQRMQGVPDGDEKNAIIGEIMEKIASTMPPTAAEKFNAYRYQNLLSSPRTQLRNVLANTFNTLVTRPATLFTGALGDAVSSSTGKPRERYFAEVPEYYKGLLQGFFDGNEAQGAFKDSSIVKGAKAAWKGTADVTNPDLIDTFGDSGIQQARMKQLPKKWTVVSRLMEAQDKIFSGMISGGEYAAQVKRGVPVEEARKAAHEMAEYSLLRQALDPNNANGQGKLLSAIDSASQGIADMAAKGGGAGRWIVPFIRTPLNFGKQWIEFSPIGLANATVGDSAMRRAFGDSAAMSPERRLEALNKGLLGTSVLGFGAVMAADDRVTFAVPSDTKGREMFYAEGKKPYSIKVGDKWIPLINFGPFGLAMALPAAVQQNFVTGSDALTDSTGDKLLATALDLGQMLSDQTFLNGIGDLMAALREDDTGSVEKVLANLVSQTMPLSGLTRYISTAIDPTYREAKGFTQSLQKDIPFLSKSLPAQTNALTGEEVKRNASDYFAPYSVGGPDKDPNRQENIEVVSDMTSARTRGANGKTKTSEEITKALTANDYAKAESLAKEHNDRVMGEFREFLQKHGQSLADNPGLQQAFNEAISGSIIPLNESSINRRMGNEQKKREFSDMLSR